MRLEGLSALVAVTGAAAAGVVPVSITHTGRSKIPMHRRSDTYTQSLTNNISYGGYFASISIGTPSQSQQVVLDTGSSDTWFLSSDASACSTSTASSTTSAGGIPRRQSTSSCVSTFDYSSSSSFTNLSEVFDIQYVDGSTVAGYYFTDDITIGGATIDTLQMGLADESDITYGIMGIGFEAGESTSTLYPNIIDKFYTEGLIGARAYSLYLDDLSSSTGTILFGGIDSDKYTGSLIAVPIIEDASINNYTSFAVTLSSVAAVYSNGTVADNYTSSAEAVILDSGTTLTYLPETMAQSIMDTFSATYDESLGYATVDCNLADESDLVLEFQFGGSDGPAIQVALSELVIQDGTSVSFGPGGSSTESSTCAFGVSISTDTYLLGDTFLRSAYVVYDLDAKEVALAQSNLNSTTTSITAITSGSTIPLVSSTATAVMASSTGTSLGDASGYKSGAVGMSGMAAASLLPVALGAIAGAMLILA